MLRPNGEVAIVLALAGAVWCVGYLLQEYALGDVLMVGAILLALADVVGGCAVALNVHL